MEQTDTTAARNSLPSSTTDRTMELRKSQMNLLSSNMDDGNSSLNEVCFFVFHCDAKDASFDKNIGEDC